nr:hypothetical protein GCM10020093_066810 [Planobispora longispora]
MTMGLEKILTEGLKAILADPAGAVVGLDFDGTLAPIVPDPESARIHPAGPGVLARLGDLVGSLVIVTGRPAATAVEYGSLDRVPGLVVLGHYGLERWEAGSLVAPPVHPGLAHVRAELPRLIAGLDGVRIEDKDRSVAVHTRRAPEPQAALDALRAPVGVLAAETGLAVEPGKFVLELRPRDRQGHHAERLPPGTLGPLGAVRRGRPGGRGGVRGRARLRAARGHGVQRLGGGGRGAGETADIVVDGPAGVIELLGSLADALAGS